MLKNVAYTIRDQSAIFQLAIVSSLAGAREYIMYCSLKNQALSSLIVYNILFHTLVLNLVEIVNIVIFRSV
jgi:hypothetical protein